MEGKILWTVVALGLVAFNARGELRWDGLYAAKRAAIADSIAKNCKGDVRWMMVQSRADAPYRWQELIGSGFAKTHHDLVVKCRLVRLLRMYSFHPRDGVDDCDDWCYSYSSAYAHERRGRLTVGSTKRRGLTPGSAIFADDYVLLAFMRRHSEVPGDVGEPEGFRDFFRQHVYRPIPGGVFRVDCTNRPHVAHIDLDVDSRRAIEINLEKMRQHDFYVTISAREMSEVVYLCQKGEAAERLKAYNGFREGCPLLEDMSDGAIRTDLGKDLEKAKKKIDMSTFLQRRNCGIIDITKAGDQL